MSEPIVGRLFIVVSARGVERVQATTIGSGWNPHGGEELFSRLRQAIQALDQAARQVGGSAASPDEPTTRKGGT